MMYDSRVVGLLNRCFPLHDIRITLIFYTPISL